MNAVDWHYSFDSEDDFSSGSAETLVLNNSSFQSFPQPDDYIIRTADTPGFKPFTEHILKEIKQLTSRICSINVWCILSTPIFFSRWLEISFKKNRRSHGRIAIIRNLLWRKKSISGVMNSCNCYKHAPFTLSRWTLKTEISLWKRIKCFFYDNRRNSRALIG